MWIGLNSEDGLPLFSVDQIMMIPAVRNCYKHFGIHGLYYAILFGWEGSPYRGKVDLVERNALAYMAIKDVEIYDPMKQKKMRSTPKIYRDGMFENVFMKQAMDAINSLIRIPALEMRRFLLTQIDDIKLQQGKMKYDATNAIDFKRQMETNNIINKQVKEMTAEIEKIDKQLEERFKADKTLSLNELILMA